MACGVAESVCLEGAVAFDQLMKLRTTVTWCFATASKLDYPFETVVKRTCIVRHDLE
jgi:hypothetical protein